jgi:hypothetical protein
MNTNGDLFYSAQSRRYYKRLLHVAYFISQFKVTIDYKQIAYFISQFKVTIDYKQIAYFISQFKVTIHYIDIIRDCYMLHISFRSLKSRFII